MISFNEFLKNHDFIKAHAILMQSPYFFNHSLTNEDLLKIMDIFCGIKAQSPDKNNLIDGDTFYHPDVFIVNRQSKSIKREDLTGLHEFCMYPSVHARKRFVFFERVQRLTPSAANAILKCIEEPNIPILFLMTTPQKSAVLSTIVSRCQHHSLKFLDKTPYDFKSTFEPDDAAFLSNIINSCVLNFVNLKVFESHLKKINVSSNTVEQCINMSSSLAKKYSVQDLQDFIIYLTSERLIKNPEFCISSRGILEFIRLWNKNLDLNPTTQYWLLSFFLSTY